MLYIKRVRVPFSGYFPPLGVGVALYQQFNISNQSRRTNLNYIYLRFKKNRGRTVILNSKATRNSRLEIDRVKVKKKQQLCVEHRMYLRNYFTELQRPLRLLYLIESNQRFA